MDNFSDSHIEIGGSIPRYLGAALAKAICDDTIVYLNSEDRKFIPKSCHDLIKAATGHTLQLWTQDRTPLDELAEFLVDINIGFDCYYGSDYSNNTETVYFRPGMKEPVRFTTTQNGEKLVDRNTVAKARNLLQTREDTKKALELLNKALGPNTPKLTPLKLTESTRRGD